jgi:mitochondrial fission protein ELM1
MGITRNLGDNVESWTYENFNEAERIATIVNKKLNN